MLNCCRHLRANKQMRTFFLSLNRVTPECLINSCQKHNKNILVMACVVWMCLEAPACPLKLSFEDLWSMTSVICVYSIACLPSQNAQNSLRSEHKRHKNESCRIEWRGTTEQLKLIRRYFFAIFSFLMTFHDSAQMMKTEMNLLNWERSEWRKSWRRNDIFGEITREE